MTSLKSSLFSIIKQKSFRQGDFTLSSGRKSSYYFDCKPSILSSNGLFVSGKIIFQEMNKNLNKSFSSVGGPAIGSVPLCSSVSIHALLAGKKLPVFISRTDKKGYGANNKIEGLENIPKHSDVLVIEDVLTTGKSALNCINELRNNDVNCSNVLCLIDREDGGKENLSENDVELFSLFKLKDFI